MKSVPDLLLQLGLNHSQHSHAPNGWLLLNKISNEGSVVIVKLDGQRSQNCYTLLISDGLLGGEYFRKDGDDLDEMINEGANFYDRLIWSVSTSDSTST